MSDDGLHKLTVRIPAALADAIEVLRLATGRDKTDIVVGALRTYLADQRRRDTIEAFFQKALGSFPQPFVVTATVTLDSERPPSRAEKALLERTLGIIDRFAPTEIVWSDELSFTVRMAASGHDPDEATRTVEKMIRNRMVEELGLEIAEQGGIVVLGNDPLRA
jgi:hypothetical protein